MKVRTKHLDYRTDRSKTTFLLSHRTDTRVKKVRGSLFTRRPLSYFPFVYQFFNFALRLGSSSCLHIYASFAQPLPSRQCVEESPWNRSVAPFNHIFRQIEKVGLSPAAPTPAVQWRRYFLFSSPNSSSLFSDSIASFNFSRKISHAPVQIH